MSDSEFRFRYQRAYGRSSRKSHMCDGADFARLGWLELHLDPPLLPRSHLADLPLDCFAIVAGRLRSGFEQLSTSRNLIVDSDIVRFDPTGVADDDLEICGHVQLDLAGSDSLNRHSR